VKRVIGAAALPLLGLSKERRRIEDAVRRGESVLLLGPAGSGKTTLVKSVAASTPGAAYVEYRRVLHDMLASLAAALIESRHPRLTALARNGNSPAKWAAGQTSVHLRGVLWSGLEASPCLLILDNIEHSSFQAYRFFQRVYFSRGMRIIAVARDPIRLGELRRLFWDPRQTIQMMPLPESEASRLFELAADQFGLREFDLDDFRPRVLDNAKGNPGQIVEMCRMAREAQYRSGRHILFTPLRIDLMSRYLA
jgi:energy-coupling factor transporter ATP-binding protein EcfA2